MRFSRNLVFAFLVFSIACPLEASSRCLAPGSLRFTGDTMRYESGYTNEGLFYEVFSPPGCRRRAEVFVLFAGLQTTPGDIPAKRDVLALYRAGLLDRDRLLEQLNKTNYWGDFLFRLAEATGREVAMVCQPALSERVRNRVHSRENLLLMLDAALELVGERRIYPLSHSLGTQLGLELEIETLLYDEPRFMSGALMSVYTSMEDALADSWTGKAKRIPWLPAVKWVDYALFVHRLLTGSYGWITRKLNSVETLSTNPLSGQAVHDGEGDRTPAVPAWGGKKQTYPRSVLFLKDAGLSKWLGREPGLRDLFRRAANPPLYFVTEKDRLSSPHEQHRIGEALGLERVSVQTGHRIGTEPGSEIVLKEVVRHFFRQIENPPRGGFSPAPPNRSSFARSS